MAWFKRKKNTKEKRKKGDCSWGNKREFWECFLPWKHSYRSLICHVQNKFQTTTHLSEAAVPGVRLPASATFYLPAALQGLRAAAPSPNPIMCLVGSQRVGTPPLVPVCVASQLSGHVQRWGPDPGLPLLSAFSRGWLQEEGSFSLHFQDKVSFMRAACWTNQVNWEALNSSHWADPSFLLKADSADGEITSALNSGSPSLNFTPISGRRGSEQTCDTGVVQFSCAGSEVYYHYFFFFIIITVIIFLAPPNPPIWAAFLMPAKPFWFIQAVWVQIAPMFLERWRGLTQQHGWLWIDPLLSVVNIKITSDLTHGRAAGNINFKKMFSVFEADSSWFYCFYGIISL